MVLYEQGWALGCLPGFLLLPPALPGDAAQMLGSLHVLLIPLRRGEGKCLLLGKETRVRARREPAMSAGHGAPCLAVLLKQQHMGEGVGSGPTRLSPLSQVITSSSTHLLPKGQKETSLPQMKPAGNISIPAGSRSMISMFTALGFSPSWALSPLGFHLGTHVWLLWGRQWQLQSQRLPRCLWRLLLSLPSLSRECELCVMLHN